ncbi:hypothetical protein LJC21_01025 [Bacteroides sp. OttesenSCG-928-E20]|nr:hypothetical protein [Bacteroides sp. OttesenSCG-928-N06]MDL2299270.1 hypothetical protein [Bacteroides sp. OttesenSCG-928-E20]
MKTGEIDKLLNEFYEGKTTEAQEELLRNYFLAEDVPERLLVDKRLFLSFRDIVKTEVPQGLEDKLTLLIDEKAKEEKHFIVRNNTRISWRWISGIAASLLLLFGMSMALFQGGGKPKDTFTDPQDAYNIVQAALIEVSATLNDGIAQLTEARQNVTEINNEIIEEIQ